MLRDPALKPIWDDAAAAIKFPVLKVPMTPFQLGHLLYSKRCYECGKYPVQKAPLYSHRVILCKKCEATEITSDIGSCIDGDLHPFLHNSPFPARIVDMLWTEPRVHKRQIKKLSTALYRDHPVPEGAPWFNADLKEYCFDGGALVPGYKSYDRVSHTLSTAQGPSTKGGAFFRTFVDRQAGLVEDGVTMAKWDQEQRTSRKDDLEQIKAKRRSDIEEKLRQLGWTDEDFSGDQWQKQCPAAVRQAVPLTDRAFENMLPALNEWVAEQRAGRALVAQKLREHELRAQLAEMFYNKYVQRTANGLTFPRNLFLSFPHIRELWQGKTALDQSALDRNAVINEAIVITESCAREVAKKVYQAVHDARIAFPQLSLPAVPPDSIEDWETAAIQSFLAGCPVEIEFRKHIDSISLVFPFGGDYFTVAVALRQFENVYCFSNLDKFELSVDYYGHVLDSSGGFDLAKIIEQSFVINCRHVIVKGVLDRALAAAGTSEQQAKESLDSKDCGAWWCADCAQRLYPENVRKHVIARHLYAPTDSNPRGPGQDETDDLQQLAVAQLPDVRYSLSRFDPAVPADPLTGAGAPRSRFSRTLARHIA